jgi:hypothetical protein
LGILDTKFDLTKAGKGIKYMTDIHMTTIEQFAAARHEAPKATFTGNPIKSGEHEIDTNESGVTAFERNSANIELFLKGKDGLSALYAKINSPETYIDIVKEAIEKAMSLFSSDRTQEAATITNTILDLMRLTEKLNPGYEAVFNGNKEVFDLLGRNLSLADLYKTKIN